MRRWLLAGLMVLAFAAPIPAQAHPARAWQCSQLGKTAKGVKLLIKCAAPRLRVSTDMALSIAYRESRYSPRICNSSDHCGVYQDSATFWRGLMHYVYGKELGSLTRLNGRANVILNLRYVKHNGWGPWGF